VGEHWGLRRGRDVMLELLIEMAAQSNANEITSYCLEKHNRQINAAAACASDLRAAKRKLERQEMRDFMDANPHYHYPGMALPDGKIKPLDPCWGKTRLYGTHRKNRC
jgi:hypothetical protein